MSSGAAAYTTKRGKTKKGKLGQRKDAQSNNERKLAAPAASLESFLPRVSMNGALGLLSTSEIQKRKQATITSKQADTPIQPNTNPQPPPTEQPRPRSIIHNRTYFPIFEELSDEDDPSLNFFTDEGGNFWPLIHWCFVAEIVRLLVPRKSMIVRDMAGAELLVAFYLDDDCDETTFDFTQLKEGRTLCLRYAEQHNFMDGSLGIRVETLDFIHVIKGSLQQVLKLADSFDEQREQAKNLTKCNNPVCKSTSTTIKACAQCHIVGYCSKECQAANWPSHKADCLAYSGLETLLNIDYEAPFENHEPFRLSTKK